MPTSTRTHDHDVSELVSEREAARRRLQARREFASHLAAFLVVNSFLVVVWALTGGGYFWPAPGLRPDGTSRPNSW